MQLLHRPDLFGWSRFDERRNLDFCSVAWARPGGHDGQRALAALCDR